MPKPPVRRPLAVADATSVKRAPRPIPAAATMQRIDMSMDRRTGKKTVLSTGVPMPMTPRKSAAPVDTTGKVLDVHGNRTAAPAPGRRYTGDGKLKPRTPSEVGAVMKSGMSAATAKIRAVMMGRKK